MRDEARNTASHEPLWTQTTKLRQKPVVFVSAGFIDPLKENKPPDSRSENKSLDGGVGDLEVSEEGGHNINGAEGIKSQVIVAIQASSPQAGAREQETLEIQAPTPGELAEEPSGGVEGGNNTAGPSDLFFFDLGGDKTKRPAQLSTPKIPAPRSEADESDSSEDIILFRGRTPKGHSNPPSNSQHKHHGTKYEIVVATHLKTQTPTSIVSQPGHQPVQSTQLHQTQPEPSGRYPQVTEESGEADDEDAILADYITNMANDSDNDILTSQLRALSQRELGGDHGAFEISSGSEASEAGDGDKGLDLDEQMNVDDETLARLLAKQELLGIDSDEFPISSDSYHRPKKSSSAAYRPKKRHVNNDTVLDAFNDLDLASWAPPLEMRRRRKQPPAFNVSDSELESALRKAWEADRERKKNRKIEREARRASGLLGKNVNPDDLRVKYQEGMKLDDMKYELLIFLTGISET